MEESLADGLIYCMMAGVFLQVGQVRQVHKLVHLQNTDGVYLVGPVKCTKAQYQKQCVKYTEAM